MAPEDSGPSSDQRPALNAFPSTPNVAGCEGVADDPRKRRSPFGPIPSLLSNTVFSSQSPAVSPSIGATASRPGISRSNSLPAHISRPPPAGNAVQFARGASRFTDQNDVVGPETASQAPEPEMSRTAAVVMLLLSTALVAVCAEFLVDAIPEMIASSSVSEAFIGLIILPIVGNAAEHVTAVSVATKNKMDLSIGVSVGSSIQIGKIASIPDDMPTCAHSDHSNSYFRHTPGRHPGLVYGQGDVSVLYALRDYLSLCDHLRCQFPRLGRPKQLPRGCPLNCSLHHHCVSLSLSSMLLQCAKHSLRLSAFFYPASKESSVIAGSGA